MKLIDARDLSDFSSIFRGENGHRRAEIFMKVFAIDKVNSLYDNSDAFTGSDFASRLLTDLGINYIIGNAGRLMQLPEGAFITVSNHPYGGLDGIILIDLLAGIRADYKFMVNKILSMVKTMKQNFISVTPVGNRKKGVTGTSINGIRETLTHLKNGHPVGFFPSGAVSDFSLRDLKIRDRKWQKSVIHLIRSVKVPILPVRFFDGNSAFFYFLGLINWRIRLLRQPSELFNKKDHNPRIGIGEIIPVADQEMFNDDDSFGLFLRKAIYEMPVPDSFIPRVMLNVNEQIKLESHLINT